MSDTYRTEIGRDEAGRAVSLTFQRIDSCIAELAVRDQNIESGGLNAPAGRIDPLQRNLCGKCGTPLQGKQKRFCSDRCRFAVWDEEHPRRGRQSCLPGESRVERAFAAWIDSEPGRYVEAEVIRLALEDRAAGDRRGEINLYLALVRRASRGLAKDRDGYACNNSHRSLLARRIMAARPELAGYFRTRDLRGRR